MQGLTLRSRGRFKFDKGRQPFIRPHNETLSVAAMRVSNPDSRPLESTAEAQPQLHPATVSRAS